MSVRCAVLVLAVISSVIATDFDVSELCQILPTGTTFRNANSCRKYYTCRNNEAVLGTCLPGLYFDKETGKCNDQDRVNCEYDPVKACKTKGTSYFPDFESCQHYYVCINGDAKRVACPDGINFDPEQMACSFDKSYKCARVTEETLDICKIIPEKTMFQHHESCNKYKMCVNEQIYERSCPNSMAFDKKLGKCNFKSEVNCEVFEPTSNNSSLLLLPEVADICGMPSKPIVGFVSDRKTCRGFYECTAVYDSKTKRTGMDYNPKWKQCGKMEIFDEKTNICQPRTQVHCKYDRCDGWNNDSINAENDGCTGYILCDNNEEFMRLECPHGFYFDENKQDCVSTPVKYRSCAAKHRDNQ